MPCVKIVYKVWFESILCIFAQKKISGTLRVLCKYCNFSTQLLSQTNNTYPRRRNDRNPVWLTVVALVSQSKKNKKKTSDSSDLDKSMSKKRSVNANKQDNTRSKLRDRISRWHSRNALSLPLITHFNCLRTRRRKKKRSKTRIARYIGVLVVNNAPLFARFHYVRANIFAFVITQFRNCVRARVPACRWMHHESTGVAISRVLCNMAAVTWFLFFFFYAVTWDRFRSQKMLLTRLLLRKCNILLYDLLSCVLHWYRLATFGKKYFRVWYKMNVCN